MALDLTPSELETLWHRLQPFVEAGTLAAIERAQETSGRLVIVPGIVASVDGPDCQVATADSPGAEQSATRVGGGPPDTGDRSLVLFLPGGGVFALGTIPNPPP